MIISSAAPAADGMYGGIGDDVYLVDNAGDYAIEAVGEGHDTIFTSVSYTLIAGSEIELLSAIDNSAVTAMNLTGNDLANEIWGNDGVNVLTGAGGDDALIGFRRRRQPVRRRRHRLSRRRDRQRRALRRDRQRLHGRRRRQRRSRRRHRHPIRCSAASATTSTSSTVPVISCSRRRAKAATPSSPR